MLFGTFMLFFAWAIYLDSIAAALAVIVFIGFMLGFIIRAEEKRLRKDFGGQYEEYRQKVSMFIPWFPKRRMGAGSCGHHAD